jgi:NADH-quinone oxidoreductase subunit J
MTTATLLAYVVAGVALVSAAGVVLSARSIYSALCLVGNMVSLAVLFLLLNAQFVAAVQVIIYAGAVMVLFVFIIALLDPGHDPDYEGPRRDPRLWVGIVAVGYITAQVFALAVNGTTYSKTDNVLQGQRLAQAALPGDQHSFSFTPDAVNAAGNVQVLGRELFTTFLLPFEITSLLLFVAAIGAVYLTRRLPHAPGTPVEREAPVGALPEESAPDAGRETVAVGR